MQNLIPGPHWGKLIDAGLAEIGDNKTPAMVLAFQITHAAGSNGDWVQIEPVTREVNFWLTEKATERSFDDMRALGFNGDFDAPVFDAELREGVVLDVTNEQYQGKTKDVVRLAKLRPSRERNPVAKDVVHKLAARFKQSGANTARPSSPPPPRPAATGQQPVRQTVPGEDAPPF